MAKNFSKYLGKIALMTAAVLWAGCNDSEKKADEPLSQKNVKAEQQVQEQPKKDIVDSVKEAKSYMKRVTVLYGTRGRSDLNGSDGESIGNALAGRLNGEKSADKVVSAESSDSDSVAVTEQPKDSLLKRAARIAKVKSEMGMIRALYGVIEENMGRAVALYGVRPPREIISPDDPREISRPPRSVPRCLVKELTEEDVVVGEGSDIDVQTLLKVFRQRSPSIRHICNKNIYKNVKYRAKRTKEFEGKTVFEMKISPSGNVENVEIKSTNDQFSEEIRKSIARWAFPKTQRGGTFTFPINLYEVIPSAASSASEQPLSPTEN